MNFLWRFLKKTLAVQKKLTFSMLDCWSIGQKGVNNIITKHYKRKR